MINDSDIVGAEYQIAGRTLYFDRRNVMRQVVVTIDLNHSDIILVDGEDEIGVALGDVLALLRQHPLGRQVLEMAAANRGGVPSQSVAKDDLS